MRGRRAQYGKKCTYATKGMEFGGNLAEISMCSNLNSQLLADRIILESAQRSDRRGSMGIDYDIFEILLNGRLKWHLCARGEQRALAMLKAEGSRTANECFAINLCTREIIGRVNSRSIAAQSIVEDPQATAR